VPSSRKSLASWLERRGFSLAGSLSYPFALGHTITTEDIKLDVYLRAISHPGSVFSLEADSKNPPEPTILTLNTPDLQEEDDDNHSKKKFSPARAQQQQPIATTSVTRGIPLPPHWRPEMYINQMPPTPSVTSDDPDNEGIEIEEKIPIDVD
jgi:hypothetical protein